MTERIGLEATLDLGNWSGGVGKYLSDIDKMSSKTGGFASSVGGAFQNVGKIVLGATAAIGAAAAVAGVAIGKFVVDGISQAADLDAQLSTIAATLNKTKAEVAPLNDLILKLGLDPNLVVTAEQAADAIENLARNGLNMTQILDGAARSTVLLANATGADFPQAADIATDVMQQFKIAAKDLDQAVNGITATTNVSKLTIDDYQLAIGQAGGVASAMGVSFDDFNTALAATSPLFASGSDAGTSYKTFLQRLVPTTKAQIAAQQALGLEFFDSQGNMKSMADISAQLNEVFRGQITVTNEVGGRTAEQSERLKHLQSRYTSLQNSLADYQSGSSGAALSEEKRAAKIAELNSQLAATQNEMSSLSGIQGTMVTTTRSLTEEEKNHYATVLFGTDAMRTAFGLADAGAVIYTDVATAAKELGVSQEAVNKVIEGGVTQFEALQLQMGLIDANEQAATRMDNFKGKLNILQGQIETIQLSIGQKFLPVLTRLAEWANDFVAQHAPGVIAFFDSLATKVDAAIAVVQVLTQFIQTGELVSAAEFGMNEQTAALADSWADAVVNAIDFVKSIRDFMAPVTDAIGKFVSWKDVMIVLGIAVASVVIPAIIGMIAAIAPVIAIIGGAILVVAALRNAWESNFLGIRDITESVANAFTRQFEIVSSVIQALTQFIQTGELVSTAEFGLSEQTAALADSWVDAAVKVYDFARAVGATIQTLVHFLQTGELVSAAEYGLIGDNADLADSWVDVAVKVYDFGKALADTVSKYIDPFASAVQEHMSGALQEVEDFVTGNETEWTHVKAIWNGARQSGQTLFDDLKSFVTDGLPVWRERLTEWGDAAAKWITDAIPVVIAEMDKWLDATVNFLADTLPRWIEQLTVWGNELWAWIAPALTDTLVELDKWATGMINYMIAQLPKFRTEMLKWATALVEWVSSNAADAIPELGRWLGKVLAWVALGALQFAAGMVRFAKELVAWISHRDAEPTSGLSKWLKLVTDWVAQAVKDFSAKMTAFAKGLIEWITSPAANPDPELDKFKSALLSGIERVKGAFIKGVQEFAQAWWDTINEYVDWNQVGQDVINQVRDGISSVKETVYTQIRIIVEAAQKLFNLDSWLALGAKVLNKVTDGVASVANGFYGKITNIVTEGAAKFLEYDWSQIGTDIIQGVIDGLDGMKQAILDKIGEIAGTLPDWMKELLGIASPSKVFAQIGRDMMLGLVVGIQDASRLVTSAIAKVAQAVQNPFVGIRGGNNIGSAVDDLLSIYTQLADMLDSDPMRRFAQSVSNRSAFSDVIRDTIKFASDYGIDPASLLPDNVGTNASESLVSDIVARVQSALRDIQSRERSALELDRRRAINAFWMAPLENAIAQQDDLLTSTLGSSFTDFGQSQIQPLIDQFNELNKTISLVAKANSASTTGDYLTKINDLVAQRKSILDQITKIGQIGSFPSMAQSESNIAAERAQLELLQKAISMGITPDAQAYGAFSDMKTLQSLIKLEQRIRTDTEANLLNQIRQTQIDQQLAKLPTVGSYSGTGSDFVSRYQQTVLDPMLETMRKLSTTDEQRAALITRYRQESEKILQLQQKQQQLDYLNQQLSLVQQITKLNDDFDDLVSVQDILAGITFGVNASIDDMLLLTSRTIDAMIATVKKQLGIASPSKVFAQIGGQIMAGLAQGVSQPLSSLMGPRSSQPYSVSNNRSLAINMGGVTVANGMDEVMFEAFIHRTVEGMLFA